MEKNESLSNEHHIVRLCPDEQFEMDKPIILSLLLTEDDKLASEGRYLSCYWCEHKNLEFMNHFPEDTNFNKKLFKDIPQGSEKKRNSYFLLMSVKETKKIDECEDVKYLPILKENKKSGSVSHSGIFGNFEVGTLKRHLQFLNCIEYVESGKIISPK